MNILINYVYDYYPYTTASYYEMAARDSGKHRIYRTTDSNIPKIDFVLNFEPCHQTIKLPNVPAVYYEIDQHVIMGNDHHHYFNQDLILLAQNNFKKYYGQYPTDYLPLGCYPKLHKRYLEEPNLYDIGIIGNLTYTKRRLLVQSLKTKFKVLTGEAKPGEEYSRKLNQCTLTFNCAMKEDVNMRFFEAQSCGRMLLTDYLPTQDEFAKEGEHYRAYLDTGDMMTKVEYYLKHEKEREKIAQAGMKNIQENHTYGHRIDQLVSIVQKHFKI